MKMLPNLVIASLIIFACCKKANNNVRRSVPGTYTGITKYSNKVHYFDSSAQIHDIDFDTVYYHQTMDVVEMGDGTIKIDSHTFPFNDSNYYRYYIGHITGSYRIVQTADNADSLVAIWSESYLDSHLTTSEYQIFTGRK